MTLTLSLSLRFISELYKTFLSVTLPFVRASTATNIIIAVIVKSVRSRTSVSHEIKIIKHLTLDNKLQVKWQRNIIIFRQLLFFFFIFLFFLLSCREKPGNIHTHHHRNMNCVQKMFFSFSYFPFD